MSRGVGADSNMQVLVDSGFTCPGNQCLVLASVSYANVSIADTTNSIVVSSGGTFSRAFFNV